MYFYNKIYWQYIFILKSPGMHYNIKIFAMYFYNKIIHNAILYYGHLQCISML